MKRAAKGAGDRLAAALRGAPPTFAGTTEAVLLASEDWTSITFSGERHRLRLTLAGTDAGRATDTLVASLAEPDLAIPGHLLVDLQVTARIDDGPRVELELAAITVEKGWGA